MPPERLWADPKGLEEWWDRIKARKDFSQGRTEQGFDPRQIDEEVIQNDLVRQFKDS